MQDKLDLFITCSQGLEQLLQEELGSLGYDQVRPSYRGAYITVPHFDAVYKINYCSRIAGRVLLPLFGFKCYDSDSLYRSANKIDWLKYIPKGKTFAIDANVRHRNLTNSLFAAQVVKDAICDQFRDETGSRPDVDTRSPDVQLNLFIQNEQAVISFDTSGAPLYKRGYRQETVEAPLNESLAAALLQLAQFKGDEIVCDPCCGSGTLLIESALISTKTPPGYLRKVWGFMCLPEYSQHDWLKVKNQADQQRKPLAKQQIFGCEINKNAVRICKTNLRAAGFHEEIEIAQSDFSNYIPPLPPTFIITNPPHGKRLDDEDSLRPFYRSLGQFLKQQSAKPARGFIFSGSLELTKEVGLAAKRRFIVDNSGIESRLLEYDLY